MTDWQAFLTMAGTMGFCSILIILFIWWVHRNDV